MTAFGICLSLYCLYTERLVSRLATGLYACITGSISGLNDVSENEGHDPAFGRLVVETGRTFENRSAEFKMNGEDRRKV